MFLAGVGYMKISSQLAEIHQFSPNLAMASLELLGEEAGRPQQWED